jgi:hypothetical protein
MEEIWKPVNGFEGRYEVSSEGRVRSVPFMQRYLLRNGREAFRRTRSRIIATQLINSGYLIVHLHLDDVRVAKLVHRLVAVHFVGGFDAGREVNHMNGVKTCNRADNLEWITRTENHTHAVAIGLNVQAIRVRCPKTGEVFPSMTRAARARRVHVRTVRAQWERVQ